MCDKLCIRATAAFFSNRPHLTCLSAAIGHRLRVFHPFATASIQRFVCVVSVKHSVVVVSTVLRLLRCWLGCWVLVHTPPGLQLNACKSYGILRHCVKLGARVYSHVWDSLLARQVWQLNGHVIRIPPASLTLSVLLGLQPSQQQHRTRTGPKIADIEVSSKLFPWTATICMQSGWFKTMLHGN